MLKSRFIRGWAGILVLFGGLAAGTAQAGVQRGMDEIKHALGWDTLGMKTVEKDASGRVTLERNNDLVNRVKRETTWFSNGKKASETVTVVGKQSRRTLYFGKKTWSDGGDLMGVSVEDDTFNRARKQVWGQILEQRFDRGRLVHETQKRYSEPADGWNNVFMQDVSYFDDGDMRERDSENPLTGEKTRETWGPKSETLGRVLKTENWDTAKGAWN